MEGVEAHQKCLLLTPRDFTKTNSALPILALMFAAWQNTQFLSTEPSLLLFFHVDIILESLFLLGFIHLEVEIVRLVVGLEVSRAAVHGTAEHVTHALAKAFHEVAASKRSKAHVEGVESVRLGIVVILMSRSKVSRLLLLVSVLKIVELLRYSPIASIEVVALRRRLISTASVGSILRIGELIADSIAILQSMSGVGVDLDGVLVAIEAIGEGGVDCADDVEVAVEGEGDCGVVDDKGVAVAVDGDDHLGAGDAQIVVVAQNA